MLILRGIDNLLDEPPALKYASARGYDGIVLQASGDTGQDSDQTIKALAAMRADPTITALYGFSGGGYNVRHVIADLTTQERARIKLVVVLGAPSNPQSLYAGPWELVYRDDPPAGHMAGPQALLDELSKAIAMKTAKGFFMTYSIVDTNRDCTNKLAALKADGVSTVIRYVWRGMSAKVIRASEARAFQSAGMRLGLVYEGAGDKVETFSDASGFSDATFARDYAPIVGAPYGAVIWFAVDFDADTGDMDHNILPYFRGVARGIGKALRVGVYGSGFVCEHVRAAGLAQKSWLTCSSGWSGTRAAHERGAYDMLQHLPSTNIADMDTDANELNPALPRDIGDFIPFAAPLVVEGGPMAIPVPEKPPGAPSPKPMMTPWWAQLAQWLKGWRHG